MAVVLFVCWGKAWGSVQSCQLADHLTAMQVEGNDREPSSTSPGGEGCDLTSKLLTVSMVELQFIADIFAVLLLLTALYQLLRVCRQYSEPIIRRRRRRLHLQFCTFLE